MSSSFESIVTCFNNDVISFWDWKEFAEKIQLFYGNKERLRSAIGHKHLRLICGDIDAANGLLAVGGRGRYLYLWSIERQILWQCIVLPITIKHVIQIQFLQKGVDTVLVLGDDGQIVAVNHKTLDTEFYISKTAQFIKSFAISGTKRISCTMSDGSIEIVSIPSLLRLHTKSKRAAHSQSASASKWDIQSVMVKPPTLSTVNLSSILSDQMQAMSLRPTAKSNDGLDALRKAAASKLSVDKLRDYLTVNGCFADKYRSIAWKFLLNLPGLTEVYGHHQSKGVHPQWQRQMDSGDGIEVLDVHSRSKQRLLRILSLLSRWCSLCQHIDFLPALIYPFVRLHGSNEMDCFECILSILCKYASEWRPRKDTCCGVFPLGDPLQTKSDRIDILSHSMTSQMANQSIPTSHLVVLETFREQYQL